MNYPQEISFEERISELTPTNTLCNEHVSEEIMSNSSILLDVSHWLEKELHVCLTAWVASASR